MSDKLKVAIIGCGVVAKKHIKAAFHNSDYIRLVAVSDLSDDSMEDLVSNSAYTKSMKAGIKFYNNYLDMLAAESPDIVMITTPSGTHYEISKVVLTKGINVLIEKPMTLILEEARELNNIAAMHNARIALGHIYRYFPIVEILSREIRSGTFGKVLYGEVKVFWGHGQSYYDKAAWRGTWDQDGGVLMNQSIHALDLMNYLMGSKTVEVTGMIARQTHNMEAEDIGMGILKMDDGSFFTITGTTSSDPKLPSATFHVLCTEGSITAGIRSGKPFFKIIGKTELKKKNKKLNIYFVKQYIGEVLSRYGLKWLFRVGSPHSWILRDLCEAIIFNRTVRADGLSGERSLQCVLAIYHSAKSHKAITLPFDESMAEQKFSMDL